MAIFRSVMRKKHIQKRCLFAELSFFEKEIGVAKYNGNVRILV